MRADDKLAKEFFVNKFGDLEDWSKFHELNNKQVGKDTGTRSKTFIMLDVSAEELWTMRLLFRQIIFTEAVQIDGEILSEFRKTKLRTHIQCPGKRILLIPYF